MCVEVWFWQRSHDQNPMMMIKTGKGQWEYNPKRVAKWCQLLAWEQKTYCIIGWFVSNTWNICKRDQCYKCEYHKKYKNLIYRPGTDG